MTNKTAINPSAEAASHSAILDKRQVAALLGCTPRFVELEVLRGKLRQCKPSPKFVRFLRRDVEAYLDRFASIAA